MLNHFRDPIVTDNYIPLSDEGVNSNNAVKLV